jgi:hypothetical protein
VFTGAFTLPVSALPPDASLWGRRPNQFAETLALRAPLAHRKTTNDHEEASMTATLISLSLTGLVAIAVWEALS